MKITAEPRLFWFLKEGTILDLDKPSQLDLYVQQVVTRGRFNDVKLMLKQVSPCRFSESFKRLRHFLPLEVRLFWDDFLAEIPEYRTV